jgi:hypothetical protein
MIYKLDPPTFVDHPVKFRTCFREMELQWFTNNISDDEFLESFSHHVELAYLNGFNTM